MLSFRRGPLQPSAHHVWGAREKAVGMRVVGRPHNLVRADEVGQHPEAGLDRLERDPAIALEQFARPGRQPGIVEYSIFTMAVHAMLPRHSPAAACFENPDADFRMLLE